jgi:hypothetical protein
VAEDDVAQTCEGAGVSTTRQLARVEGFGVETTIGRVGRVVAVVPPRGSDGCGLVLVHPVGDSCALTAVPFEDVEEVDLGSGRIVLAESRPSAETP